jgi:hypothetical protein
MTITRFKFSKDIKPKYFFKKIQRADDTTSANIGLVLVNGKVDAITVFFSPIVPFLVLFDFKNKKQ